MEHRENIFPLTRDLIEKCSEIGDFTLYRDLSRMTSVLEKIVNELDRELVQCRNQKKYTLRYLELLDRWREQYQFTGKYLMVALLSKGSV